MNESFLHDGGFMEIYSRHFKSRPQLAREQKFPRLLVFMLENFT